MVSGTETPTGRERIRLVSIVLPTYEGDRYLAEAIRSCLTQTYPHLELLIVDDGSRGDIRGIVEANQDARVRYLRHSENRGLSAALNTGFGSARGDYLTWTSDDNRYHPEAIERMVEYLEAHPGAGLVYAGCREIDERGTLGGVLAAPPPDSIWTGNCVRACFLYRREVQERVGLYDPELPLVEDYDYWLRTARRFRLARLDAVLYDVRDHRERLTRTLTLDRMRESYLRALAKLRDPATGPPVPAGVQRQARAVMHVAYGRNYFFAGRTREARRDLWAAIRLQPRNLARRQVLEPLIKSLAGDRIVARVRARHRVRAGGNTNDGSLG